MWGSLNVRAKPAQEARLDHVLGAIALAYPIDGAVVDGLHHVALGLQLRAAHHRAEAGHNPRVGVAQLHKPGQGVDASANPRAGQVVQFRIPSGRRDVADGQHVRLAEEDVDVSARVSFDEVPVVDGSPPAFIDPLA